MKEKGKSLGGPVGEDMISKLPDALISEMLFYLPTKEAVRTSVLSKRWKSLWLLIPGLDLDSTEFPDYNAFVSFVDKFVDFSKEHKSCLHKLKLNIHKDKNDESTCVTPWVDFVATHKPKHLEVEFGPVKRECLEVMPVSIFISETLLFLKLHRVLFGSFDSVALPQLKTMHLEENVYANEAGLKSLITSCPVLEDLIIVRRPDDNVTVLRVHSQTLITLSIANDIDEDVEFDDENSEVLIDAPRLKYLNLNDDAAAVTISNSGSLTKVNLDHFNQSSLTNVRNLFTSISGVKDMSMSWNVFESIEKIMPFSTQFCNLSCLEIELYVISLDTLPEVLERCPNLKSLRLEILYCSGLRQLKLSSVPGCLLASLEFVEIKNIYPSNWSMEMEMELARYFIENALVLKKLVLPLRSSLIDRNFLALRDLLALPRRSSTCQIDFC